MGSTIKLNNIYIYIYIYIYITIVINKTHVKEIKFIKIDRINKQ